MIPDPILKRLPCWMGTAKDDALPTDYCGEKTQSRTTGRKSIRPVSLMVCVVGLYGYCFGDRHYLDIERDFDFLADQDSAGFQRLIPGQAEILAVDSGCRRKTEDGALPERVFAFAQKFDIQRGRSGRAANGQIAVHLRLGIAYHLDAGALESDFGIICHIQEIRATQMPITISDAGPDAVRFDRRFDIRVCRVVGI